MNIYFYGGKNFGDAVSKLFWQRIISDDMTPTTTNITTDTTLTHYVTIGSIMHFVKRNSIIFGAGFISETSDIGGGNGHSRQSLCVHKPLKILSVRGPLTRAKLITMGINCPENYGDPLILMPCFYSHCRDIEEEIVGIIPHFIDKVSVNVTTLKNNLTAKGYQVKLIDINIGDNYHQLLDEINTCRYIISSSLHGLMMGLIYKKIVCFVEFSNNVIGGQFKFNDFFQSIGIDYKHKQSFDSDILVNSIQVDYNRLVELGTKLIGLIPSIDDHRKAVLVDKYVSFYKSCDLGATESVGNRKI